MISHQDYKQYVGNTNKYTASAGTSSLACMNSLCVSFAFTSVHDMYPDVTDTSALRCSPSASPPPGPAEWPRFLKKKKIFFFLRCWKSHQSHLVFLVPRNACLWLWRRFSRDHENSSILSLNDPCYELATTAANGIPA